MTLLLTSTGLGLKLNVSEIYYGFDDRPSTQTQAHLLITKYQSRKTVNQALVSKATPIIAFRPDICDTLLGKFQSADEQLIYRENAQIDTLFVF